MFGAVFRSFLAEGEGITGKATGFRGGGLNAGKHCTPFYGAGLYPEGNKKQ